MVHGSVELERCSNGIEAGQTPLVGIKVERIFGMVKTCLQRLDRTMDTSSIAIRNVHANRLKPLLTSKSSQKREMCMDEEMTAADPSSK